MMACLRPPPPPHPPLPQARTGAPPAAPLDDAERARVAAALGYGGVKYFDLRLNRNSDYVFNYDRMLSPDGDTATYMQYAHARVSSILRRARESLGEALVEAVLAPGAQAHAGAVPFAHASELLLAIAVARFQEVITDVQRDLLPHHLCEYLFALAGATADFHRDCNVLGEATPPATRDARLRIVAATAAVMRTALKLLGITPLERI